RCRRGGWTDCSRRKPLDRCLLAYTLVRPVDGVPRYSPVHQRPAEESAIATPCTRCGRPAAADDRFCGGCGAELAGACARFGRALATDVAFCTSCGSPRSDRPAAS